MYSKEKIKWMTQAALYEQKQERKDLHAHKFGRVDYISFYLFKILICYTIAFALIAGAVALYLIEERTELLHKYPIGVWLFGTLIVYILILFCYVIAVLIVYSKRYDRAESSSKRYILLLKGIAAMNREETGKKTEGVQSRDSVTGN